MQSACCCCAVHVCLQGTSAPIAIPNMAAWRGGPDGQSNGRQVDAASTFIPPHQLSRQDDFTFSFTGASPSATLKRERLRARNAILRSTGEQSNLPACLRCCLKHLAAANQEGTRKHIGMVHLFAIGCLVKWLTSPYDAMLWLLVWLIPNALSAAFLSAILVAPPNSLDQISLVLRDLLQFLLLKLGWVACCCLQGFWSHGRGRQCQLHQVLCQRGVQHARRCSHLSLQHSPPLGSPDHLRAA